MGRLTEYFGSSSSHRTERNGDIEVVGFDDTNESLGHIMTVNPEMEGLMRSTIRKLLREARNHLSKDVKAYLKDDPRKAYRAIKYSVYKTMFGGNLSILQKRRAGAKYDLIRPRKVAQNPHMRGGNRRPRVDDYRNRLAQYYGADRGFVLRFINSGTEERETRFGRRGSIRQTDWFGHTAPWEMDGAAAKFANAINEYVNSKVNG